MVLSKLLLFCVLALGAAPMALVTARAADVSPAKESAPQGVLSLARSGNDVMVTWMMPTGDFKQIEIYRSTNNAGPGRTRAAAVRSEPRYYLDKVTDLTVTYWYWLKLTRTDGQVVNVGPVATPFPTVWQP